MKKILFLTFILAVFFAVACQKAIKDDVMQKKEDVMKKIEIPKVEATGEAVVDAVGNDLNNVDNIERDLSSDELTDLDSGLADVQTI